jgi:hypothetical protein
MRKPYVGFQVEPIGTAEEENEILKRALEKNTFFKQRRKRIFNLCGKSRKCQRKV